MATSLSSCGTASHMVSQASGLVSTAIAPVTGILRLSDSEDSPETAAAPDKSKNPTPDQTRHDRQRIEAKRRH